MRWPPKIKPRYQTAVSAALFGTAIFLAIIRLAPIAISPADYGKSKAGFERLVASWAGVDFKSAVYYPVVAYLEGENPYDHVRFVELYSPENMIPFPVYPPMILLVHLPFGLFPFWVSFIFYMVTTVVLCVVVALLAVRYSEIACSTASVLLVAALMLISRPGHMNLLVGNITLQVVAGAYIALGERRSALVSGLGLTISMIKPTFGVPIAIQMLVLRKYRAVLIAGAICTIVNLPLAGSLAHRAGGTQALAQSVAANYDSWLDDPDVNPVTSPFLYNPCALLAKWTGQPVPGRWVIASMIGTMLVVGAALFRLRSRDDQPTSSLVISIICLGALVGFHHQPYDLLLLTFPIVALLGGKLPSWFKRRSVFWCLIMFYGILGMNYLSTHSGLRVLGPGPLIWKIVTSINGFAIVFLFVVYLAGAFVIGRPSHDTPNHT